MSHEKPHSSPNRTVFVVFSDAFQELTLVRTRLLDDLILRYNVILIVGSELVKNHVELHYRSTPIAVFLHESHLASWCDRAIHALIACKYEKFAGPFRQARRQAARSKQHLPGKIKSLFLHALARIMPETFLLHIKNHAFSGHALNQLYNDFQPVLTILSWGGVYEPCPQVHRSARKFGCRTISIDASWDCMDELTAIPKVDRLLVWNEPMKREAVQKHRYNPTTISVVGPLRCDFYRRQEYRVSREEFFKKLGLDHNRRLLTLAINRGNPEIYCRIVDLLMEADRERRLCHPIQIYVRLAPWSNPESFRRIKEYGHAQVRASYNFSGSTLVQEKEIIETVNLLQHSDILLSVLSTLILESAFFNTPNISLRLPEFRTLYERDFLTPLYETGGVAFVDDLPALLQAVNRYLADPQHDAQGRKAILRFLCHGGDGMVKKRVLGEIERIIGK
jgi:hypothetical protein